MLNVFLEDDKKSNSGTSVLQTALGRQKVPPNKEVSPNKVVSPCSFVLIFTAGRESLLDCAVFHPENWFGRTLGGEANING